MRKSRSNGTASYEYIYDGDRLSQMTIDGYVHYVFLYDADGPMALRGYNSGKRNPETQDRPGRDGLFLHKDIATSHFLC